MNTITAIALIALVIWTVFGTFVIGCVMLGDRPVKWSLRHMVLAGPIVWALVLSVDIFLRLVNGAVKWSNK